MKLSLQSLLVLGVWALSTKAQILQTANCTQDDTNIYGFQLEELTGEMFSLDEYQGKVLAIFNVATY